MFLQGNIVLLFQWLPKQMKVQHKNEKKLMVTKLLILIASTLAAALYYWAKKTQNS